MIRPTRLIGVDGTKNTDRASFFSRDSRRGHPKTPRMSFKAQWCACGEAHATRATGHTGSRSGLHRIAAIRHRFGAPYTRREMRETKAAAFGGERDSWFISAIEDREREMILKGALGRLAHEQQELITLKIWGELTFKQIAKVLDISPNTAASRYRYALGNLRHALEYTAS